MRTVSSLFGNLGSRLLLHAPLLIVYLGVNAKNELVCLLRASGLLAFSEQMIVGIDSCVYTSHVNET